MKTYFASFCLFLTLSLSNKVQSQSLNTAGTFLDKKGDFLSPQSRRISQIWYR
jgi:hypothetical protein